MSNPKGLENKTLRLSSSCLSIRNKSYINFQLAETIHSILNIAKKSSLESCFGLSNTVFRRQNLIQTERHAKGKDIKHSLILL